MPTKECILPFEYYKEITWDSNQVKAMKMILYKNKSNSAAKLNRYILPLNLNTNVPNVSSFIVMWVQFELQHSIINPESVKKC